MSGFYKIPISITAIFFLNVSLVTAQRWNDLLRDISHKWEINIAAGANNFLGDIGGRIGKGKPLLKDYTAKTIKPLIGASGTYHLNKYVAFDGGFNFTTASDADSLINNSGGLERWRVYRNGSFRSNIVEAYVTATVYPTMYFEKIFELRKIVPFITCGLGVFHFKPQGQLNGSWIDLQPLNLEGQGFPEYPDRKPYKLTQIYIPGTIGVKYYFNNKFAISTGLFVRKTFTDYIDDISTTYIDPALFYKHLPADKAILAAQLYSRSITPWKVRPDVIKAFKSDKDSYVTFFIALNIRIERPIWIYYPTL